MKNTINTILVVLFFFTVYMVSSACGRKKNKQLIAIIDDGRCGNHFTIYWDGGKVVLDSTDTIPIGVLIPLYLHSELPDTSTFLSGDLIYGGGAYKKLTTLEDTIIWHGFKEVSETTYLSHSKTTNNTHSGTEFSMPSYTLKVDSNGNIIDSPLLYYPNHEVGETTIIKKNWYQ